MIMHADNERKPTSAGDRHRNSPEYATAIDLGKRPKRLRRKGYGPLFTFILVVASVGTVVLIHEADAAIGIAFILALCLVLLVWTIWRER